MKIEEASITFLVSSDSTTIEIRDKVACTVFCRVKLTPQQLSMALSRLSDTPCEADVYALDRVGKKHENETFQFEIPRELRSSSKSEDLLIIAKEKLEEKGMSDWIPDTYFSSQSTFVTKNGKEYCNVTIRRWI